MVDAESIDRLAHVFRVDRPGLCRYLVKKHIEGEATRMWQSALVSGFAGVRLEISRLGSMIGLSPSSRDGLPPTIAFPRRRRPSCTPEVRGSCAVKRDAYDGPDGSEAARERFSELVLPYLSDAYALARLMTGSRADAEDVVQEACLRAFRAIDRAVVTSPRSWVLAIVHNAACTWLARNRPADIVAVDDLEAVEQVQTDAGARNDQSPEASVIARTESERLRAAIQTLPAAYREVLVLRDIEGLSYRELAGVLDVPVGTVMSRLARARARLMAAIGETGS